ncbi:anti-virulence regulator CigR family protein [Pseudomonas aeruginosa]|uniref:anti-virulence regulator CigR family protein n=1 Tax=Pseudomonas aeruginosa TaxID=287 RepID=UPI00053DAFD9|nr:anti-virulence regulator CigR family protein [Pseudomonas aeruginosa]ELJ2660773.1 RcnB family protein [Pseudomonas aeruginosa]KAF0595106.1 hypothetical protein PAPB9_01970 [Pseudomonas aeruginosa]KSP47447.1 hypothetical protein APB19_28495 [Pseudomonas aeruginosa]MBG3975822.1 RcnB family protein [Pseudomonas aeruginosa]MBG5691520.1 RcnB family protein [Pseudomonas aeruginosa]
MFNTRSVLALVVSLSLIGGTPAVLADPGNGKGNPHGNQMDGGKGNKGNKGNQGGHDNHGGPGNKGGGAGQKGNGDGNWDSGPRIDVGGVRVILGDNRGYWNPGPALPPGIQKNLARGKPLPPGIAKKLDGRLLGRLPHYDGYEWMQAGTDLLLVAVATGLIYEVLDNVLD